MVMAAWNLDKVRQELLGKISLNHVEIEKSRSRGFSQIERIGNENPELLLESESRKEEALNFLSEVLKEAPP